MKVVKKTDEYTIYQRRDNRYAVQNASKQHVNGDDKIKILSAESLIKAPAPKPEPVEEAPVDEAPAEEAAAEGGDEAAAEEAPAE